MNPDRGWKEYLCSVAELFQEIDWTARTHEIYQQIATTLLGVAGCSSVSIRLLSVAGDEMIGHVFAGMAKDIAKQQFPTLTPDVGRMSVLFEKLQPIVYEFDAPKDDDIPSDVGIKLGFSHAVTVPLASSNSLIGAIDFLFKEGEFDPDPQFIDFLVELCRILGPISAALSTSDELVELRGEEEAKRIGSELHDNFAQPMSVIVLEADKAVLAYEDGDENQLKESLYRVEDLARQSFEMMAQEIAMLHSAMGHSDDLSEDIRRYISNFERQWGLNIQLELPAESALVPKGISNQAMRILHEAMSNVLRHSRAKEVNVKMKASQGAIELSIEDNGCGFDTTNRSNRHLGLRIMEERARSVGGRLTIVSFAGEGTTVIAGLPLIS